MSRMCLVPTNLWGCDEEHIKIRISASRPLDKAHLSYVNSWEVSTPTGSLGCFGIRNVLVLDVLVSDD